MKKGKSKAWIVLIIFFILIGLIVSCIKNKVPENIQRIMTACETTKEQATSIDAILTECELINIEKIEHDEMLDGWDDDGDTGYRITNDGVKNIILYLDINKDVRIIRYADVDMYNSGEYGAKFYDFFLTSKQESVLRTDSQTYVEAILKSPSTADFPWFDWQITKDYKTQIATVSSYVDAQNSFGATIRSYFTLKYQINGSSYSLIYFEFDGEILIDKR